MRDSTALYILRWIPLQRALRHRLDHRHRLVLNDLVDARHSRGLCLDDLLLLDGIRRGLLGIAVVVGLTLFARECKVEVRHIVFDDDAVLVDDLAHVFLTVFLAHNLRGAQLLRDLHGRRRGPGHGGLERIDHWIAHPGERVGHRREVCAWLVVAEEGEAGAALGERRRLTEACGARVDRRRRGRHRRRGAAADETGEVLPTPPCGSDDGLPVGGDAAGRYPPDPARLRGRGDAHRGHDDGIIGCDSRLFGPRRG
mmetsp:Transcript_36600/g.82312  ORF Transcript_36600/g.82312 Transcript_36600/m.82312 type:complete len:255 (+) Transcript_36600:656-1420(+)